MSEAKIGKYNGENNPMYGVHRYGLDCPMFGKKHSDEVKIKIGLNSKGRKWVNNGIQNKFIKPEELEYYKSLGFIYQGCLMNNKKNIVENQPKIFLHYTEVINNC